jgi:hypothetical protein
LISFGEVSFANVSLSSRPATLLSMATVLPIDPAWFMRILWVEHHLYNCTRLWEISWP